MFFMRHERYNAEHEHCAKKRGHNVNKKISVRAYGHECIWKKVADDKRKESAGGETRENREEAIKRCKYKREHDAHKNGGRCDEIERERFFCCVAGLF